MDMPLEIREIGISMRVGEQPPQAASPPQHRDSKISRDDIVDECVRRVLQMLKTRQER
ncbi:hypothetical protein JQ557_11070 [Bradyrhizobium sp. U87765 SZCCT0131]|uniref:DUF5908 family protein n=2 Tax=Bradyrhizobium TaxID=374 RepID=UPI001BA852B8|nr:MULTISPECIES: DUF5908 family protein [unclassified Bradyrhizobium]MBR1218533.1 hypothetical protein [Bradyrhizobium sp. U87765 SZCCT0131]MBR1260521.1 hypothetical protein [Bradyrhizobium sp. U87765 SZCCT0134]MBR1304031.1 hypothetical protein [Bradyrhizobium sp. U87765 SZCCT0110]MBR1319637.1 hypothetical protein [Bradyrhizobium sp. U87765 SZCCT0109]